MLKPLHTLARKRAHGTEWWKKSSLETATAIYMPVRGNLILDVRHAGNSSSEHYMTVPSRREGRGEKYYAAHTCVFTVGTCSMRDDVKQWSIRSVLIKTIHKARLPSLFVPSYNIYNCIAFPLTVPSIKYTCNI